MADDGVPPAAGSGKFYVYVYRDPRPGKNRQPIYVGKGIGDRAELHWRWRCANPFLAQVLGKIRGAGLAPTIEIVERELSG